MNKEFQVFQNGQWVETSRPVKHGAYSTYSNRGCRCDECRQAHAEWHRQYRHSESGHSRTLLANRRSRRIQQLAAQHLKTTHPEEYENILRQVEAEVKAP